MGTRVPVTWSQALAEVNARLKSLRDKAQPHKLLLLHGLNTTSDQDIIYRLAEAYGTPNVFAEDTLANEAVKAMDLSELVLQALLVERDT